MSALLPLRVLTRRRKIMKELIANQEALLLSLQEKLKDSINSLTPKEISHLAAAINLASHNLIYLIGSSQEK